MKNKTAKKFRLVFVGYLVGLALGVVATFTAIHFAPKHVEKQCPEIAVTGTPGASEMSMQGNDLFLTGVVAVKCHVSVPQPQGGANL